MKAAVEIDESVNSYFDRMSKSTGLRKSKLYELALKAYSESGKDELDIIKSAIFFGDK